MTNLVAYYAILRQCPFGLVEPSYMSQPRYIAIEGPIGAGKTSLAKRLAADLDARLFLEQPDENPFLQRFYEDPQRYAFSTQLAFLLSRYQQQQHLQREAESEGITISDYSFLKDWVFAELNLEDDELQLYRQLYTELIEGLPKPDLVIYLEADAHQLKKHVKQRKVAYEKKLKIEYLENVLEAYKSFFFDYNESPLLVVNCTKLDFVNNEEHYLSLYNEIFNKKRDKKHYVALGA